MKEFKYEEVKVGDRYTTTFKLSRSLVEDYFLSFNEEYKNETEIPSSIFAIYTPWYKAFGGRVAQGTIHLKQRMEYYHKVKLEDTFKVVVNVTGKFRRKERDYLIHETCLYKEDRLYCKQTTTQLWAFASY